MLPKGYSFKTNQYGLTIDTVKEFELVLPNGTVTTVTSSSDPDLFFGLKVRKQIFKPKKAILTSHNRVASITLLVFVPYFAPSSSVNHLPIGDCYQIYIGNSLTNPSMGWAAHIH